MAKYQPIPESDDGSGNFQSNGLRRRKQIMMIAIFGIVLTASGIVAVAHNKTTYYKMGQAIEESSRGMKKLKHTASVSMSSPRLPSSPLVSPRLPSSPLFSSALG